MMRYATHHRNISILIPDDFNQSTPDKSYSHKILEEQEKITMDVLVVILYANLIGLSNANYIGRYIRDFPWFTKGATFGPITLASKIPSQLSYMKYSEAIFNLS